MCLYMFAILHRLSTNVVRGKPGRHSGYAPPCDNDVEVRCLVRFRGPRALASELQLEA